MIRITHEIKRWLAQHDIDREGVHVTIQFPNKRAAAVAQSAIMRELVPLSFGRIAPRGEANETTLNGISLTLDYQK